MLDPNTSWLGNVLDHFLVRVSIGVVATVGFAACGAPLPAQRTVRALGADTSGFPCSIVVMIHGDGDYLYHDTDGREYQADEEALARAKAVAEHNPGAEMFIFHQRPRQRALLIFPVRDGEFYYYRDGRLAAQEAYWRDDATSHYGPEVALYRRFRDSARLDTMSIFIYYGHEIPEFGGAGYDASSPERTFTVRDFASGLGGFTRESRRFDLMVLSTCFGGTPYTISAVGPFARYVVASPDNLHLSYFDLQSLEGRDLAGTGRNVAALTTLFARRAFERLTREVQTTVSVATYDVDRVQGFLRSVEGEYHRTLTGLQSPGAALSEGVEHCDCAELPGYSFTDTGGGVNILYRAPLFGRARDKLVHSGWECWREKGLRAETTEPAR